MFLGSYFCDFTDDDHFVNLFFYHDNSTIITGGDDGLIRLYSLEGKATVLLDTLCGHGGWILKLRKCPDNRHFVSTSADGKMKVWDILSRECVSTEIF